MARKSTLSARERRRFPVGTDPKREKRRADAEVRTEARAKRSVEEQLALIEERPGLSLRERARLEVRK